MKAEKSSNSRRLSSRKSKAGDETMNSHPSVYSLVVDSSDDEIDFKTPPKTVKKRKLSKEEVPSNDSDTNDVSVKDEPLSSDDEDEETAVTRANEAAAFIKLSSSASKAEPQEPVSRKKAKKLKKPDGGKVIKFRKAKRYYNTV